MQRPRSLHSRVAKETRGSGDRRYEPRIILSAEEEAQLARDIQTFKRALSLREEAVFERCQNDDDHCPPSTWVSSDVTSPVDMKWWAQLCGYDSVMELRRVIRKGQEARSRLVDAHVGLVTSVAKRHYVGVKRATEAQGGVGTILSLQDLVQEGTLGLMEAAERFDASKGARFGTYATYWIRQRVARAVADSSRIIRLPAHVHTKLTRISKARKALELTAGRAPTSAELAQHLDMSEDKLLEYTELYSRNAISLESPVSTMANHRQQEADKRTLGDRIAWSEGPSPEELAQSEFLKRDILAAVRDLASRERDVVMTRFGLLDGKPKSIRETAERLGLSVDRVRLVEARALNKLRHPQRNYRLKDYVASAEDSHHDDDDEYYFHNFPAREREAVQRSVVMTPERMWSV